MGDFSDEYTKAHKGFVYISQGNKKVEFKPFVSDFSYEVSISYSRADPDNSDIYNDEPMTDTFNFSKYSLTLNVNAANVNEAIENHKKFQILARIVAPDKEAISNLKDTYVKFSNLVSKDGGKGINNISSGTMKTKGFKGVIKEIEYTPEVEMGFFFYQGKIFAKHFSLKIEIATAAVTDVTDPPLFKSGFNYRGR